MKEHSSAPAFSVERRRVVLVELLEKKVVMDSAMLAKGMSRTAFPMFMQDWLLHKHGNRHEAMLALGGITRGILDHKDDTVAAILGSLSGVLNESKRPYSARCGELLMRVVMQLRHVQPADKWTPGDFSQDTADVLEALMPLKDPSSSVELSFATAAYQQAAEAEGYTHTVGDRISDMELALLGAVEGSVPIDQVLEFAAQLFWDEDQALSGSLKAAFQKLGRPAEEGSPGGRQVTVEEFKAGLTELVEAQIIKPLDDQETSMLYWRCCTNDGDGDFSEPLFVEAVKAWAGEARHS